MISMDNLLEDEDEIDLAYNKGFEEGFKAALDATLASALEAALDAVKEDEMDGNKTHS